MARCFYPGHDFDAAIRPGVRQLRLMRPGPGSRVLAPIDRTLDEAAASGWANVLLPGAPVLTADPTTGELIRDLLVRMFSRQPRAACENHTSPQDLRQADVAVGVSHNAQKDLVRVLLDDAGLSGVTVDTANRLQGLTFELVVAWHPLAGSTTTDDFHLDPGRLCVLLTRHRHACIVVGRDSDRALLDGVPPATPGYLGWDPDPVLDGWGAHEGSSVSSSRTRFVHEKSTSPPLDRQVPSRRGVHRAAARRRLDSRLRRRREYVFAGMAADV